MYLKALRAVRAFIMKTYCKEIDITNPSLIREAIEDCIKHKKKRKDVLVFFRKLTQWHDETIKECLYSKNEGYDLMIDLAVEQMRNEIINKKLIFNKIRYNKRKDPSSGKIREIGIQDIKQQFYDYLAVYSLRPLFPILGTHQCASIKGKGQEYGVRNIKRWLKDKSLSYFVKIDIKKCYESIDQDILFSFLKRKIKNHNILWLIKELLKSFSHGLSIGSYLSQYLCNLFLSQIYHFSQSDKCPHVKHTLLYMDDILFISNNKQGLRNDVKCIISFIKKHLHLNVKPNWIISKIKHEDYDSHGNIIEMMGYRVYRNSITLRKRIYKRFRRIGLRIINRLQNHLCTTPKMAKRILSYKGKLLFADINKDFLHCACNYSAFCISRLNKKRNVQNRT